jgi:GNAT superfamily N-acetyltransferase
MLKIRDALDYEIGIIGDQRLKAYEKYAKEINEEHWNALRNAISSDVDKKMGVELLVAELDEEVAGSVALFPAKSDAYVGLSDTLEHPEIRMLAVREESRGSGVGKALIRECILRSQAKGSRYIGLHTSDFMQAAVRLYERMGFERMPKLDFQPANDGIIVKAYRLAIEQK